MAAGCYSRLKLHNRVAPFYFLPLQLQQLLVIFWSWCRAAAQLFEPVKAIITLKKKSLSPALTSQPQMKINRSKICRMLTRPERNIEPFSAEHLSLPAFHQIDSRTSCTSGSWAELVNRPCPLGTLPEEWSSHSPEEDNEEEEEVENIRKVDAYMIQM